MSSTDKVLKLKTIIHQVFGYKINPQLAFLYNSTNNKKYPKSNNPFTRTIHS